MGVPADLINLAMLAVVGGAVLVWLIWPDTCTVTVTRRDPMRSVYLAVFFAALVVLALAYLTRKDSAGGWMTLHLDNLPTSLAVVLALQLLAVFGEELGWRGLVQPVLERRFPVLAVVALVLVRAKRRRDNTVTLVDRYGTAAEQAIVK